MPIKVCTQVRYTKILFRSYYTHWMCILTYSQLETQFTRIISEGFSLYFHCSSPLSVWAVSFLALFLCFTSHTQFRISFTNKLHAIHNVHFDCKNRLGGWLLFSSVPGSCIYPCSLSISIRKCLCTIYAIYMAIELSALSSVIYGCTTNISLHSFHVAFDYSFMFAGIWWQPMSLLPLRPLLMLPGSLLWNMNCMYNLSAQVKNRFAKKVHQRFKSRTSEQMTWIDSTNGAHSFTVFDYCNLTFGFGNKTHMFSCFILTVQL